MVLCPPNPKIYLLIKYGLGFLDKIAYLELWQHFVVPFKDVRGLVYNEQQELC